MPQPPEVLDEDLPPTMEVGLIRRSNVDQCV
jgi:hypothetical protein